jgi:hypothetical protein
MGFEPGKNSPDPKYPKSQFEHLNESGRLVAAIPSNAS